MAIDPSDIRALVLDVDGVLTDGTVTCDDAGLPRTFHVQDGLGIVLWQRSGRSLGLISGRNSQQIAARARELDITNVIQGSRDKIGDLTTMLGKFGCTLEETAFVGDDLNDLGVMQRCGYAIAVANAVPEILAAAHWTTPRAGGSGAVRDAIEHLMRASGDWAAAVASMEAQRAAQ